MTAETVEPTSRYDASGAQAREDWLARMEVIFEEDGHFDPVGPRHHAWFADQGPTLLVSFESYDSVRARPTQVPGAQAVADDQGWSHLCLIAEGETWYRDPYVYRYFDRLVDDAFFEDFDRVLFYGAGIGGYAACAFSVCAPGATVLAISPRATLNPDQAGWDRRHLSARKLCFTDRFGYAPAMIEGTAQTFVVFDPRQAEDAMHAALLAAPYVHKLRTPFLGDRVESALANMEILPQLLTAAGQGSLTPAMFHQLWRKRRVFGPYLRDLLAANHAEGKHHREVMICNSVIARSGAPKFRRYLAWLKSSGRLPGGES
ncbi:phosphoadenosine phosphosulfate reductase [Gemmobacter denitrificans]|uniref:Phosphoadenosine phosphosulfate reductase n=1 Tax=Gemmobacter denitrificans TaxID=3123040 RepID=A0ABU8BPT3_9RHOB